MEPLASRLRPQTLDDVVGQQHLIGEGKPLRVAIEKKELFSFILWGPPGSGKTTLARIYANGVGAEFHEVSAVDAGKEDMRRIIKGGSFNKVQDRQLNFGGKSLVLFVDEIHRFNKAQQDFLLPFVENGTIALIGATTENPSFEVISALLSRCRVFVLKELQTDEMLQLFKRTKIKMAKTASDWLVAFADGDARRALTTLEATERLYGKVTLESLKEAAQSSLIRYDKKGDAHYDTISAFIKSMRAGQADAAIYYLARMIEAGEDPKFIARRMVIFASEDVGLAQPTALVVANEVFRAVEIIGYPECSINLAHGVAYLAGCKKDRRANDAIAEAREDVRKFGNLPIPLKIRNAPTKLMKNLEYGKGYEKYDKESYLPDKLKDKKYLK